MSNRLTRTESKQRTRAEVMGAAASVFARRGYGGASMQEIADEAGRTTGAIYAHFPTKESLFLALLEERQAERQARVLALAADPVGVVDRFGAWFDRERDDPENWDLLMVEFWLFAARNPELSAAYHAYHRRAREHLAGVLDELFRHEGSPPPLPTNELAALIIAIGDGLRFLRRAAPDLPTGQLFAYALERVTDPARRRARGS